MQLKRDGPIGAFAGLTLADYLITVPFYHLESNPIVLEMGLHRFTVVKLLSVALALLVWYSFDVHRNKVGIGIATAYSAVMLVVVAINVYVVMTVSVV